MNKKCFFTLFLLISFQIKALVPYEATYVLNATSDLGSLKVGEANFKLQIDENNKFIFSSNSFTDSIWKSLYDYSRYEKSIGFNYESGLAITLYDLIEIEDSDISKNNKIRIFPEKNYAIFNNGEHWETITNNIVDELSVYLAISEDLQKNPGKTEFSYQVIDEKGIELVTFNYQDEESINIDNMQIQSMKFSSPELKIVLHVSKEYNFIPLIIDRSISKNRFRLILKEFNILP
ncbi:DUF3108 domain-containing protein [Candidatus Thioglobus sp.]|nr:DUF3108 domain-containing protein [Candidatus Thioglobus sp.]